MTTTRRPSNQHRPSVSRPGSTGLRFGMFAVCVTRDPDPGLNKGKAKPLYDLLISFADVSSRDTGQGYPYREALAACLDCSKQTVDRAADYLEKEIGLVTVHRRKVEGKPDENDANLYEIHDAWLIHGTRPPAGTPPHLVARYGHTIPGLDIDEWIGEHAADFDLAAWRAVYEERLCAQEAQREEQRRKERARRKKSKKGGGVMDAATPEGAEEGGGGVMGDASGGVMGDASGGVMGDALSRAGSPEPASEADDAPSGRSPGEPRRASTGSKGSSDGGFAAPAKSSPAPQPEDSKRGNKRPVRLTADERKTRDAVLQLLPSELREALGDVIPTNVAQGIMAPLAKGLPRERTPQELVTHRLLPRWQRYWAPRFYAGELTPEVNGKKRKPFGPLLEMLKDTAECGNLWCEDRYDFAVGTACQNCAMRKEDQAADRARERRAAQEEAERQARRGEGQAAAAKADTAVAEAGDAPAGPMPTSRSSHMVIDGGWRRDCACGNPIIRSAGSDKCGVCRAEEEAARQQAEHAARYEAPEEVFASAGLAPF